MAGILLMDDAGYFDSLHGCAKRLRGNAVPDAGAGLPGLFVDAHGGRGLGLGSNPTRFWRCATKTASTIT